MAGKDILLNFSGGKDSFTTYLKLREDPTVNSVELLNFNHHLLMYEDETNVILQEALREMYSDDPNFLEFSEPTYKESSKLAYSQFNLSDHYLSTGETDIMNELGDFWKAVPGKTKGWYNPYFCYNKDYFWDDYERWEIGSVVCGVVTSTSSKNLDLLLPLVGQILYADDFRRLINEQHLLGTVYSQIQSISLVSNQIIGSTITPKKQAFIDVIKEQHSIKPLVALY
jgi:hypothetical protein